MTMNTILQNDSESFDIEDSEDVIGLAKTLVDGHHAGILSTVDQDGRPQVRWMSTLSFNDFPIFYTLTAPDSRKVGQIERCPNVNWLFFNGDQSLILNLIGTARVLTDAPTRKRVWKVAEDKEHAYFLKQYANIPKFVVIETTVAAIECSSPKNALRFAIDPSTLAHSHWPL